MNKQQQIKIIRELVGKKEYLLSDILVAIDEKHKQNLITKIHPKYHGEKSNGCVLVKARREEVYRGHYIDIYTCLTHNVECCRCGWEWGFHNGEDSNKLKDN